jgi:glycerol uptake facilitator protein
MSEQRVRAIQPPGGILGEVLAEFAGTMILILFGTGVVAQVVGGGSSLGGHDSISWAWGFGVMLGIYVAGRVSGAHLNPAVSIALAAYQGFEWRKVGPYIAGQFGGAFVAALIVRWDYTEVIHKVDPGHTLKSQTIFATLPGNGSLPVHELGALRDQIIGTAILVFLIFAITSVRATPPLVNLAPLIIGLLVVAIGMAFGTDAGYAINPARDLGPRLAEWITGYGHAWTDQWGNQYWWVPIVGPIVGGLIGGGLYKVLIEKYLPAEGTGDAPSEVGELPDEDTSRTV